MNHQCFHPMEASPGLMFEIHLLLCNPSQDWDVVDSGAILECLGLKWNLKSCPTPPCTSLLRAPSIWIPCELLEKQFNNFSGSAPGTHRLSPEPQMSEIRPDAEITKRRISASVLEQ